MITEAGEACTARRAEVLDVFRRGHGTWSVITVEDPGCDVRLGAGLDVSVDPVTGTAEVLYSRTPDGQDHGELRHAQVPLSGPVALTSLASTARRWPPGRGAAPCAPARWRTSTVA